MFFCNLMKKRTKDNISLIAKIALVILLLAILSDKYNVHNFSQTFNRVNSFNLDFLINDVLSISKLAMVNFSIFETIGLVCVAFVFVAAMVYTIVVVTEEKVEEENKTHYSHKIESSNHFRTNNIYLLTNKFIC